MAMAFAGSPAIFSRHINKGGKATEWGVEATSVGLGIGVSGGLGGLLVASFGFKIVFVLVGTFGFLSAIVLLSALKLISPRSSGKGMIFSFKELFQKEKEQP